MTLEVTKKAKLDPIKVKPDSSVHGLGGLVADAIYEHPEVILRAIGASAVNQAMKGIVRARQTCLGRGDELLVRPAMKTVAGDLGDDVVVMVLTCTLG